MTEAEHYEKKYGIQSELLPHCIADRDLDSAPTALRPPSASVLRSCSWVRSVMQ